MTTVSLSQARLFDDEIAAPRAWTRDMATEDRWLIPIPDAVLDEIEALVAVIRANPLDIRLLSPDEYDLAACRALMRQVRHLLDTDLGVVVLDRLPVDRYSKDELVAAYWLLSSMIARPVAQSFDGRVLYDVTDTGRKTDTRVRPDVTASELYWHTDYGFNLPPPYLGLLVLRTAREGGGSSVASILAAHNALRRQAPHLLRRLYEPFHWNRQGEHPDGAPITHFQPLFAYDGQRLHARYNKRLLHKGYELVGSSIDRLGAEALDAMGDLLSDPAFHFSFQLAAGQIQFANNSSVAHRRTGYVDHDEPDRKRHLVRIFLRDEGRRSYMG